MPEWFTVGRIDAQTYVISEPRHWERPHCYLLEGSERSLLIDTGLGICDISVPVSELTSKHVTAALTHVHWDHIGGLWHYGDFCAHAAELSWLTGGFPLPAAAVRDERERGYLFTGDLVYEGTLYASYPSTDPAAYLASLERVAALPAGRVFPGHYSLDIRPGLIVEIRDAFRRFDAAGALRHGTGVHNFGRWAIEL